MKTVELTLGERKITFAQLSPSDMMAIAKSGTATTRTPLETVSDLYDKLPASCRDELVKMAYRDTVGQKSSEESVASLGAYMGSLDGSVASLIYSAHKAGSDLAEEEIYNLLGGNIDPDALKPFIESILPDMPKEK